MEKAIILLDEVKESIINAYETKSHLSRNKIAKMMSDEIWLNAKKAHEMGFVDGILFAEKDSGCTDTAVSAEEPEESNQNPDGSAEQIYTAMQYSAGKPMQAFLQKVSAKAPADTPVDQLEKRLALLKY